MVALVATTIACMTGPRDESIRAEHAVALLDGYESYETLMSDVDTDIVWFEYRVPQGTVMGEVPAKIASRIAARAPCFKIAESSADSVRVRCPDSSGPGFGEYLVRTIPRESRVFVMYAAIRGAAEQEGYVRVVKEFKDEVAGRESAGHESRR
jgi:hypothetical protein